MPPRPSIAPAVSDLCWSCQCRLANPRRVYQQSSVLPHGFAAPVARPPQRTLHVSRPRTQEAAVAAATAPTDPPSWLSLPPHKKRPIREHLEHWQQEHGTPTEEILKSFENHPDHDGVQNNMSKLAYGAKADEDPGVEHVKPTERDEDEELITIGLFLKPGDVVELWQANREPVLAVFVQQLHLHSQLFSVNGRWCQARLSMINFAVQGAVDPTLVNALIPFMPTKHAESTVQDAVHVPQAVGAPVQKLIQKLTEESERIYRTNAPLLDSAWSTLADSNRNRIMSLPQIAKTLLGQSDPGWVPSPPALLAVRKALNHNAFRFSSDGRSHRLTNIFSIRPKNDVALVETVQEWVREYTDHEASLANKASDLSRMQSNGAKHIANFVAKARRLISISRKDRESSLGFLGPSKTRFPLTKSSSKMQTVWGEVFTDADKQIINFLQASALMSQFKDMPTHNSACATIVRATGSYDGLSTTVGPDSSIRTMGSDVGQLLLQEIGVLTPHENRALYDEQLMLPTVRSSWNLELLNTKADLTRENPGFHDSMADLRRDWGSTTVFCIDDAGAQEIDDGISIERIPGRCSEYWVHVHVANPTAFFDKTHVLSGLAAHMTQAVYTPERAYPMLPKWVSQNYFSLDRNRPVITFSSRLDRLGNVIETKIQHGIIRKVLSITPTELSSYLGNAYKVERKAFVVGGEVPSQDSRRQTPQLSIDQLQDLQDLSMVAKSLWDLRKAAGAVSLHRLKADVRIFENAAQGGLTWMPPSIDRARLIQGDPVIEVSAVQSQALTDNADSVNIVEQMMLLACQSAASWCAKRNIPAIFRGTVEPPPPALSSEEFQRKVIDPQLERHGVLTHGIQLRYIQSIGRAIAHCSPIPHKLLPAKNYLKVTSPLRRFSDMIAHWQIEAALRYEARTDRKLMSTVITNARHPILPFSQRHMQEAIIRHLPRESLTVVTGRESEDFWVMQAFVRAFYYKEAVLPETFNIWVYYVTNGLTGVGRTVDMGVKMTLIQAPDTLYCVGDKWEVKIHSINVFRRHIFAEPIRLLHRDEF